MTPQRTRLLWAPALSISLGLMTSLVQAQEQTRTVDEILEQARALAEPPFDAGRKGKPGYAEYKQRYRQEQHTVYHQRAALLLEACTLHPDDDRVPKLMNRRWVLLGWNQDPADVAQEILADIKSVLASTSNAHVAAHGAYWKAYYSAQQHRENPRRMMECIEPFLDVYPNDERGADLLDLVADYSSGHLRLKTLVYRRLATDYPETYSGKFAPGVIRQIENRGKPFTLSFNDVVTGQPVSIAALRDRVVVIDFWATSCPPCIAEMPHLKELYTKYHQAGVEFIGVSLDEPQARGGLEALRAFIKKYCHRQGRKAAHDRGTREAGHAHPGTAGRVARRFARFAGAAAVSSRRRGSPLAAPARLSSRWEAPVRC
ncbi:MAG: TlpA disulfide reductase family protein [Planctomycetota bacterium]|jgi:thiol-disulfide isomerase/thioredoxin